MPALSIKRGRSLLSALFRACIPRNCTALATFKARYRQLQAFRFNQTIRYPNTTLCSRITAGALLLLLVSHPASAVTPEQTSGPTSIDCATGLEVESGRIERITDGDTVVLTDNRRVRLIGINTLELNDPTKAHRQAAILATDVVKELLPRNEPVLLFIGEESHDRHNRVLAHVVRQSDNLAVASVLLKQGHALQSAVAPNSKCADYFAELERQAREQQLGVWTLSPSLNEGAVSINKTSRGFKLITGTVTGVQTQSRYTQITLDNRLAVRVRTKLANVMNEERALEKLLGQSVEVRGWLSRRKNRTHLWMQHPANIRVVDQ